MENKDIKFDYAWNVLDEDDFKQKIDGVFYKVSNLIAKTLGPYGSQIVVDNIGEASITKDGWNILKRLRFDESDPALNSIYHIIKEISATVVSTVGDGSTSSIVLANALHNRIINDENLKELRIRERQNLLRQAVDNVTAEIQKRAIDIDRDSSLQEIYDLAYVSTNGDEVISEMIKEIYTKTKNPTIHLKESAGSNTVCEIIEGYKLLASLADGIYVNTDNGTCDINKPYTIIFDHKINHEGYFNFIMEAYTIAKSHNRRLVLIAPYYDRGIRDKLTHYIKEEFFRTKNSDLVLCVVSVGNNVLMNQLSDFAMLTGAPMVSEIDMGKYISKLYHMRDKLEADKKGEEFEVDEEIMKGIDTSKFLGEVGFISIGAKDATASDFFNRDEDMYKKHLQDAITKYEEERNRNRMYSIIDVNEYELKQRVAKLSCNIGTILVGGTSATERRSNYDLVEDAIRACESAYNYGYNVGGNLAIVKATDRILENEDMVKIGETPYKRILTHIREAALDVYRIVLSNKFKTTEGLSIDKIVKDSIEADCVYDLTTDIFNKRIINSCRTDIEILKASMSIISSLFTSSVFISMGTIHTIDNNINQ